MAAPGSRMGCLRLLPRSGALANHASHEAAALVLPECTFIVTLTSPLAFLYAIPVEKFMSLQAARRQMLADAYLAIHGYIRNRGSSGRSDTDEMTL